MSAFVGRCLGLVCLIPLLVGVGASGASTEDQDSSGDLEYFLTTGSWDRFLQEPPVLLVGDLNPDIKNILGKGEGILVNLFNAERLDVEEMVAERFEPEIEDLKTETPDVVTSDGYSSRRRYYRGGAYAGSGYATTAPSAYYTYYTKQIQRSTTPDLLREVRFAVGNIDIKSISSKIELLEMTHRKWTERTGNMPGSGSSKLIREANFTYLKRLKDYIGTWRDMDQAIDSFRQEVGQVQTDQVETLRQWQEFERNQLEALHLFFDTDEIDEISLEEGKVFKIPAADRGLDRVLKAKVSGRDLYFRIQDGMGSQLHPFRLVAVHGGG
ncbi:MAG: hypothetical protein AAGJ81_16065 [Verrucomicrobiota bacterium]